MSQPNTPLTLETVGQLSDGQSEAVINAAIAAAVRDTEDRGDDGAARKVKIELTFKKAGKDHVACTAKATTSIPPYQTKPTVGVLRLNGSKAEMLFNPSDAERPEQQVLPGTERK